ncbi:HAD family hydrolase [Bacteroides sp. OttesenSCG-928-N06]|nr:HAD family hydrolase [Bacteroides sp. OttesenSCG-928-N06]
MKNLIIFDLDGTLLNTIADLAQSTNYVLHKLGFPTHEESAYNFMVGNGINKLFERALPDGEKTEENILRVRKEFLVYYAKHNTDKSRPYPGIPELLQALQEQGKMMAVASNKYHEGTKKLIDFYFPNINFPAVYGQRDGFLPKPDPTIVFDIMNSTGVPKEEILYVGDSGVDMQTAINAGVTACGVTWGFRPIEELRKFNPEFIIDKAEDILSLI